MTGKGKLLGALCALAIAGVPAAVRAAPDGGGWARLVAGYNSSGERLFRAFAETPGNIVLSPYSIGTAMAMALAGARGGTASEMAKVLDLELPRDRLNAANAAALASLNAAASPAFDLRVANAAMLTKSRISIDKDYVALLQKKYAAEVFRGADLATVNGWVKKKTNGKIESILDRLDPSAALVLLDAIYFKARWNRPFEAAATRPEPFHLLSGEADVPMMHIRGDFELVQRPGYRALRLPYAGGRTAMVVILPDAEVADTVRRLDAGEVQALLAALHGSIQRVDVSLPRFRTSFKASLKDTFAALGMHRAFDPATADFSGMTGKPPSQVPLAIDDIEHRAVIDVAEQGTEAAAATGTSMVATAMRPPSPETFRVDRPFLFSLVDDKTGAILFQGRIVDPR